MLKESDKRTWTFEVISKYHLDACQKAKSKVYEEYDVDSYRDLRARVIDKGYHTNSLVTVVET